MATAGWEAEVAVVEAVIFVAAAGFGLTIVISVAAIIGIGQEERLRTMTHKHAPSFVAALTRRVVGRYVRRETVDYSHGSRGHAERIRSDDQCGRHCRR
jgi:hypothetical protein